MVSIEEKLILIRYNIDVESHIRVDTKICRNCKTRPCLSICPAACYTLLSDSEVLFSYSGCLECGTCRFICDQNAIVWDYPRGGFGVSFRFT